MRIGVDKRSCDSFTPQNVKWDNTFQRAVISNGDKAIENDGT